MEIVASATATWEGRLSVPFLTPTGQPSEVVATGNLETEMEAEGEHAAVPEEATHMEE